MSSKKIKKLQALYANCLSGESALFENFAPFLEGAEDETVVEVLVSSLQSTFEDENQKPSQKYYALQLLKLCLSSKSSILALATASKLLAVLGLFAQHNLGSNDPNRGMTLFEGQDIPRFQRVYSKLHKGGVIFPDELQNYAQELRDLSNASIHANNTSSGSATKQKGQPQQQQQPGGGQTSNRNEFETPTPAPDQPIDAETAEQIKKLSKFLSLIDNNLVALDSTELSQDTIQNFLERMEPLKRQCGKMSEALIDQVLALPQSPQTEVLQKKLFDLKELLETSFADIQSASQNNILKRLSSIKTRTSTYLRSFGLISEGGRSQGPSARSVNQSPEKPSQSSRSNIDFIQMNPVIQPPPPEQDIFTEYGGFLGNGLPQPNQQRQPQQQLSQQQPQPQHGVNPQMLQVPQAGMSFPDRRRTSSGANPFDSNSDARSEQNSQPQQQQQENVGYSDPWSQRQFTPAQQQHPKINTGNPFESEEYLSNRKPSRQQYLGDDGEQESFPQTQYAGGHQHVNPPPSQANNPFDSAVRTGGQGQNPFDSEDQQATVTAAPQFHQENHQNELGYPQQQQQQWGRDTEQNQKLKQQQKDNKQNPFSTEESEEQRHQQQGNNFEFNPATTFQQESQQQQQQKPQQDTSNQGFDAYGGADAGGFGWDQFAQTFQGSGGAAAAAVPATAAPVTQQQQPYTQQEQQFGGGFEQHDPHQNRQNSFHQNGKDSMGNSQNSNMNNQNNRRKDSSDPAAGGVYNLTDSQYNAAMRYNRANTGFKEWKQEQEFYNNNNNANNFYQPSNNHEVNASSAWKPSSQYDHPTYDPAQAYDVDSEYAVANANRVEPDPHQDQQFRRANSSNQPSYSHQQHNEPQQQQQQQHFHDSDDWGMNDNAPQNAQPAGQGLNFNDFGNTPTKPLDQSTNISNQQQLQQSVGATAAVAASGIDEYENWGINYNNNNNFEAISSQQGGAAAASAAYTGWDNDFYGATTQQPQQQQNIPSTNKISNHDFGYDENYNHHPEQQQQQEQQQHHQEPTDKPAQSNWNDDFDFFQNQQPTTAAPAAAATTNQNYGFDGFGFEEQGDNNHFANNSGNGGAAAVASTSLNKLPAATNNIFFDEYDANPAQLHAGEQPKQWVGVVPESTYDQFTHQQPPQQSHQPTTFFDSDYPQQKQQQQQQQHQHQNYGNQPQQFDIFGEPQGSGFTIHQQQQGSQHTTQPPASAMNVDFFNSQQAENREPVAPLASSSAATAVPAGATRVAVAVVKSASARSYPAYQKGFVMIRDSEVQSANEFDVSEFRDGNASAVSARNNSASPYRVTEVSPEIKRRNEEFYDALSKEESLKQFVDESRKQLVMVKATFGMGSTQALQASRKLELLNAFQLAFIERQDLPESLLSQQQQQQQQQTGNFQQATNNISSSINPSPKMQQINFLHNLKASNINAPESKYDFSIKQSLINAEQKNILVKELKDVNEKLFTMQEEMQARIQEEERVREYLDECEQTNQQMRKQFEMMRHELETLSQEHQQLILVERSLREEHTAVTEESEALRAELKCARQEQTILLNEVIDPNFFRRRSVLAASPLKQSFANSQQNQQNYNDQNQSGAAAAAADGASNNDQENQGNTMYSRKEALEVRQKYEEQMSIQMSRGMREGYKVVVSQQSKVHAGIQPSNDPSNLRVYGNLDKLLELNYHSNPHSERDDALVRMIGAKSLKQREKERNRLFYDATPFKEIINATVNSKANLDNFKYACLHEKAVLFENASIQVGVVSKVIVNENHYTASQAFVVNLHLINKKSTPVNITFTLPEIPKYINGDCEINAPGIVLKPRSAKKHAIEVAGIDVEDLHLVLADIHFSEASNGQVESMRLALPIVLNKFFVCIPTDGLQFKQVWAGLKSNGCVIHNEPRQANERMLKAPADAKRYFECLVDLTSRLQPARSRYGVVFRINDLPSPFYLKIVAGTKTSSGTATTTNSAIQSPSAASQSSSPKLTFKIATFEAQKDIARYICNYFCFLFTS